MGSLSHGPEGAPPEPNPVIAGIGWRELQGESGLLGEHGQIVQCHVGAANVVFDVLLQQLEVHRLGLERVTDDSGIPRDRDCRQTDVGADVDEGAG